MTLTLRIDNFSSLPDGGPLEYSVSGAGFEIGRDTNMDWTLPDPNRFVSSCHIEVRYEGGNYWLYDVSTNGTFVNGGSMRVRSPHQLQHGDRLQIGHYVVLTDLEGADVAAAQPSGTAGFPPPASGADIWSIGGAAAPGGAFDPTPPPVSQPDFGSQHISTPAFAEPAVQRPDAGNAFVTNAPVSGTPFGSEPLQDEDAESPFGSPDPAPPEPRADPVPAPTTPPKDPFSNSPSPSARSALSDQPASPPSPFGAPEHTAPPMITPPEPKAPAKTAITAPPDMAPSSAKAPPPKTPPPKAESFRKPTAPKGSATKPETKGDTDILAAICESAGMAPDALDGVDPKHAAQEFGATLRIMADELAGLLRVRAEAKQMVKSGSRTMIGHDANNPLKFIPTSPEALEVMFGPGRPGFQRGSQAIQSSFDDVKQHQFAVHAALQPAISRLLEDLSPTAIQNKIEGNRFSSRNAKSWELFVERWDAKTQPYENGMLDVFLAYFAKAYDDTIGNK
ncbi:type VI secretion system-associated FHA domain protein TagH [Actibacterium sp. 188UL27-1]|uniref:type VI secretion system-associated FHA domain protein TagH n=1 Tax=Actibacterium sp. 188UL27-1 TaxID=2786961 RepID=UPI00195C5C4A|nr:type VI secretion system-associated FHA domain protein TagH [Actibacterium sp. 188UL27-1]MBM7068832.1 type VI secretion system-associated FHA domain protein TagH [Actibacterium sp. 188UL27-1]